MLTSLLSGLESLVKAAGASHDSPRAQTCTFEGPGASKTRPKFHEKTPQRKREKERKWERERKEKSEILGGPAEGGPAEGGPVEGGPVEGGPVEGGPAEGGPAEGGPAKGRSRGRAVPREGGPHNPNHATPHELDFHSKI